MFVALDSCLFLLCSSDGLFASGSHMGELILWNATEWNLLAYEHILWEESQAYNQTEIRMGAPKPSEMSIQHLTTNGNVRTGKGRMGLYTGNTLLFYCHLK